MTTASDKPSSDPHRSLLDLKSHYDFGRNWARFARDVTDARILHATQGLAKLLGSDLTRQSFLEIGCGSGLHSLAALRLGAVTVRAVDIDPDAVATATTLLQHHAGGSSWQTEIRSVFDIAPGSCLYDIVYSWGALHHSGDMRVAVERAASLVAPGGRLVIAIYRRTPMCGFWRREKRLYARAPQWCRRMADVLYAGLLVAALTATGRNPISYIRAYPQRRGMSLMTDVRDWLGGFPYESASRQEINALVLRLGFCEESFFPCNTRVGLLGVGCDEYVFRSQLTAPLP